jgi:hypothetical protein
VSPLAVVAFLTELAALLACAIAVIRYLLAESKQAQLRRA